MEFKLKSILTIINKVVRDLGIGDKDIPWQDYIEWAAEGLIQIGAYTQFREKIESIEIEDNMGKLPDDFYKVLDNPHIQYKIQGDSIISILKNGEIKLRYLAFQVDDKGLPLVPDDPMYDNALFWKIAMQLALRGEAPVHIPYQLANQKWNFYCSAARSKANSLDEDGKNRFARMFLGLRPDINQYNKDFKNVDNTSENLR